MPSGAGEVNLQFNLLLTAAIVLGLLLLRWAVVRAIVRRTDSETWYRTRKVATYVTASVGIVALISLWVTPLRDLGTFLGLVSAGVAIALADVLKNIAGWLYIVLRRPFHIDDRIEIDGVAGDVVDIRLFRTSLLEIGNWVEADQSTGRIVHVPNGAFLTKSVANFTEGFPYLWHEVPVLVTFESDWKRAERLLLDVLGRASADLADEAAASIRRAARHYKIRYTHLTPTVYISVRDSGVLLTGRMLVDTRRRRGVDQQVWRGVLEAFAAEPSVELAYPTIRTYLPDPVHLRGPDGSGPPPAVRPADGERRS